MATPQNPALPLIKDFTEKRGYRVFQPGSDVLPGGGGGGALLTFNLPILTSQNISGGPVDGSGGGHTVTAAQAGDWIVWWEGWYDSSANSQLEVGIALNNPAAPIADSLRRSEVDSGGDPLNFQSTAFVTVVENDVIYGTASESGSGTANLQTRRLFGIKVA